ncbi:MAG: hypothetical protein U5L45_11915 [Saprospiraceae bacterium]|nr:hypothetical protein [Saprospiraceae bacterium]
MYFRIIFFASLLFAFAGCNQSKNKAEAGHEHAAEEQSHDHSEEEHNHEAEEGHEHDGAEHEEPKFQYTAYSAGFEVFAEADAFVVGETANILSHFSVLPGFKALEAGKVTVVLIVNGKETRQTLEAPTRKGIYSFDITPETAGKGDYKI